MRFTLPDGNGGTGVKGSLDVYVNNKKVKTVKLDSFWMWQYFNSGFYYRSKQQCISIVQCSRSDTGWQHLQKTGRSRLETLTKMSKYCMLFKYRNKILKGVMT